MIVKVLLIGSVLAALLWMVRARASNSQLALTRLGGLAVACAWIAAVINPNITTWIANLIGVGRGTDLVLYLLVVIFTFTTVGQYKRLRALDDTIAEMVRAQAILARKFEDSAPHQPEQHV